MPELPEVETTRRGLSPFITQQRIAAVDIRETRLRWPVPGDITHLLQGLAIEHVGRRAKYLLLTMSQGTLIIHLGMSGSLRIVQRGTPPTKHDHIDIVLENGLCVRLRDPRRFGSVLWTTGNPLDHPLLVNLGPEPTGKDFHGEYLYQRSRGKRVAVKSFIMTNQVVVGVGNIYANEALYVARIHPGRRVSRLSRTRYDRLAEAIETVIKAAITAGGTSVRDFVNSHGQPGYFGQSLRAYGRGGQSCLRCGHALRQTRIGQRSSVYCPHCQR